MAEESLKQINQKWLGAYLLCSGIMLGWFFLGMPRPQEVWHQFSVDLDEGLLPILALMVCVGINRLGGSRIKAFLVFWRWENALPGHRFVSLAKTESRFRLGSLESALMRPVPVSAEAQGDLWIRLYREHESDPAVRSTHQEYLLLRDLTWLCTVSSFIGVLVVAIHWHAHLPTLVYGAQAVAQYLLFSISARFAGNRFVLTVLSIEANQKSATPDLVFS